MDGVVETTAIKKLTEQDGPKLTFLNFFWAVASHNIQSGYRNKYSAGIALVNIGKTIGFRKKLKINLPLKNQNCV